MAVRPQRSGCGRAAHPLAGELAEHGGDVAGVLGHHFADRLLHGGRDAARHAGHDVLQLQQRQRGVPEGLHQGGDPLLHLRREPQHQLTQDTALMDINTERRTSGTTPPEPEVTFTFRAFKQTLLSKVHLTEERETTIYGCRYSKDVHRTQCHALTITSLTHSCIQQRSVCLSVCLSVCVGVCTAWCHCVNLAHLFAEVGLGQAVAVHHLAQVLQHAVEHLVELLPHDGQRLLGGQGGGVGLHLEGEEEEEEEEEDPRITPPGADGGDYN